MAKHPIRLKLAEGQVEAFIESSDGPHRLVDLASQVLGLSSVAAEMGERAVERRGAKVSCTKGCGACCRQLVPISPPEAAMIYEFVESMPQPARTIIENRFSKAVTHLDKMGLLQSLEDPANPLLYKAEKDYFLQQISCPFLVNESCGIYEYRPSRCREYLVFTPPENCINPYKNKIGRLPVSMHLNESLTWLWAAMTNQSPRYIPLILSLKWTRENQATRTISADPQSLIETLCGHIENISSNIEREAIQNRKKHPKNKKKKK